MARSRTAIIAAVAVVTIAAAGFYFVRSGGGNQRQAVRTVNVERGIIAPKLSATGNVSALDERSLGANFSGKVIEVSVAVGDIVKAGQTLIKLDKSRAEQNISIALAEQKSARARLTELLDQNASAAQIAAQEAAVAKADAEYQTAAEDGKATTISSPIDGTVISLSAAVGDEVSESGGAAKTTAADGAASNESSGLVTVADLSRLQIETTIDQADIAKIVLNQPVDIILDALPGKKFTGRVSTIDAVGRNNQNVVTYGAYISLEKADPGMRLGMSADLEINLAKKESALYVPNFAVHARGSENYVTKMIDGETTEIPVEIGLVSGERTEIVSGLSENDEIIAQSFSRQPSRTVGTFGGGPLGGGGFGRAIGGAQGAGAVR